MPSSVEYPNSCEPPLSADEWGFLHAVCGPAGSRVSSLQRLRPIQQCQFPRGRLLHQRAAYRSRCAAHRST
jgi:hypothetical protein